MRLTPYEQRVLSVVREGLERDRQMSPFVSSPKYYNYFENENKGDAISLEEAPIGVALLVITESVGTFYIRGRGTSIMRGSLIVKTSNKEVILVDAYSWMAMPSGAEIYQVNGNVSISEQIRGKVKELEKVRLP